MEIYHFREHTTLNRRFWSVIVVGLILLSIYGLFVYGQWHKYKSNLSDRYISTSQLILSALESTIFRDIDTTVSVAYSLKDATARISDILYIAYDDDGKLFSTNIRDISNSGAQVIYDKVRRYLKDEPIRIIPRMYLTYNGLVVGYVPSYDKNKLIVVVFSPRYLKNMVYRLLSTIYDPYHVRVMLFTSSGLPVSIGNTFNMAVFKSMSYPNNITLVSGGAIAYCRGRLLNVAVEFNYPSFTPMVFVLRYLSLFIVFLFVLYAAYYMLERRYFLPLDDLQALYTSYVRTGELDTLKIFSHRRRASEYFYPADIIYVLLHHLVEDLQSFEGIEKSLAGIYSLFSHLEEDFDENNLLYVNKVLDSVREILDVDGVFLLVKDGSAYKISGYSGVLPTVSSDEGIRVYSKYWDRFFRNRGGTYIEDIKKDKNIKDSIMTGISFITAFDKAIISTLGFGDMVEGLLVVLIKDSTKKDLRMLEDLVSIISYMLTVRIMLSRLKASSDEIALNALLALLSALEVKDPYTAGHSSRVALYSKLIAEKMGLNEEDIDKVYKAALLHDMGKEGVPDRILLKPAPLTKDEWEYMKKHPITSASIIEKLGRFTDLIPGILHHHTRYDGSGYPGGLKGKEIPLIARIIAVADAYDAMTTDRPYRHALPDDVALSELIKGKGKQFDPDIVELFIQLHDDGLVQHVREMVPSSLSFRSPEIMEKVFKTLDSYMFAVIDVNGMYYINSKYGKHIGDKLIDMALKELRNNFGQISEIGRLDGDHIAVLFAGKYPSRDEIEGVINIMNSRAKAIVPMEEEIFKLVVVKYPEDLDDRRSILHYISVMLTLAKTMGTSVVFMEDIKRLLRGE